MPMGYKKLRGKLGYAGSPLQGLREICRSDVEVEFIQGCSLTGVMEAAAGCLRHRNSGRWESGLKTEFFNTKQPGNEPLGGLR